MEKRLFGSLPSGDEIYSYTIGDGELFAEIITFGAAVRRLVAFGTDIMGGFDSLDDYLTDTAHQGAIIGRVANRIDGARFAIDGVEYNLPKNDGENCLHGGDGFDRRPWRVEEAGESHITLSYISPDGEEGFPGELYTEVRYSIENGALIIEYVAVPKAKTPISLTNHSYFNLDGFGGDIKSHKAIIYAENYSEVNERLIPTGEHPSVFGTRFDFTEPHEIGERIGGDFIGYDHNFILKPKTKKTFAEREIALAAEVFGKNLLMRTYTDQPGVQLYIGNFLGDGPDFKGGIKQIRHGAFCLEAQTEPNSVNLGIGIYDAGEVYTQTTVYEIEKIKD